MFLKKTIRGGKKGENVNAKRYTYVIIVYVSFKVCKCIYHIIGHSKLNFHPQRIACNLVNVTMYLFAVNC